MNDSNKNIKPKDFDEKSFKNHLKKKNNDFLNENSNAKSQLKTQKNSSPVCFSESDEIREEYKLKP